MIEFGVLGPLTVHRDGQPVMLRLTLRRLLAVFLCRPGRPVSVTELIDALWPDSPPASPRKTVQVYVHRLRQVLGEERIRRDPGGYSVIVEIDDLDATRFAALIAEARAAHQQQEPKLASRLFAQALGLWRGAPFADVTGGELVAEEVRRLDEQLQLVQEERYAVELDLGQHAQLVGELTALTKARPYREHLRALLMLALYRAGRQIEALEVFRETRALFTEQLGVEPGELLQCVHQAMLRVDRRLATINANDLEQLAEYTEAATATQAQPPAQVQTQAGRGSMLGPTRSADGDQVRPVPRQLPADVAGFTGREEPLKLLDNLLGHNGGSNAVVISAVAGTAGVGKTTLAVHWAHRISHRFPDGQLYINLRGYAPGSPMRPVEALAQFLRSLGTPPEQVPTDVDEAAALYRSLLADRSMLVLLDNAGFADQVRPLLPGSPGCLVLITSRERLGGLAAREGAYRLTLEALAPDEAVALLAWHLGAERVAAEPAATAELARLCGYLPLALRIAAANFAEHPRPSISAYTRELAEDDRLASLAVDDDQQTAVRAAFDLSYQAIPTGARRLFRLLGLVPGPDFTAGAAAALAEASTVDAVRLLDRLAGAHLIEERPPGRYTFHDLLRLYARERAHSDEPDTEAATVRLFDWYLHTADAAARALYPTVLRLPLPARQQPAGQPPAFDSRGQAMAWLDAERPNLVAAIQHAAARGPHPLAWHLADTLRGYFWMRPHGVDWLTTARAGLAAAEAGDDPKAQAAVLLSLGDAHGRLGNYRQAAASHTRATELAKQTGWEDGVVSSIGSLGLVNWQSGRLPDAVDHLYQALAVSQRTGRRAGESVALGNLGLAYWELGQLRKSARLYVQALAIDREIGNRRGVAIKLGSFAEVSHALGQTSAALGHLSEAIRLTRETGDRTAEAEFLRVRATLHRDTGPLTSAVEDAKAALAYMENTGYTRIETDSLNTLGTVYEHLGRHQDAIIRHQRALELSRLAKARYPETEALIGLAHSRLRLGELDQARGRINEAIALAEEIGYRMLEGQARTILAAIDLAQHRLDDALRHARLAARTQSETGYRLGEARALLMLGNAVQQACSVDEARPHWQAARKLFTEIGATEPDGLAALVED